MGFSVGGRQSAALVSHSAYSLPAVRVQPAPISVWYGSAGRPVSIGPWGRTVFSRSVPDNIKIGADEYYAVRKSPAAHRDVLWNSPTNVVFPVRGDGQPLRVIGQFPHRHLGRTGRKFLRIACRMARQKEWARNHRPTHETIILDSCCRLFGCWWVAHRSLRCGGCDHGDGTVAEGGRWGTRNRRRSSCAP